MNISHEQAYSYAEILEILSFTHIDLVKKIPQKLISIFKENALSTYEHHLDKTIPLENQNISSETASLITLLSINYWCKTEEEKNELKQVLIENEKKYNEDLRKKYNTDNIFNNNPTTDIQSENYTKDKDVFDISVSQIPADTHNTFTSNQKEKALLADTENLPFIKKLLLKIKRLLYKNK